MPYTENGTSIDSKPASASSANAPIKASRSFISSSFMLQPPYKNDILRYFVPKYVRKKSGTDRFEWSGTAGI